MKCGGITLLLVSVACPTVLAQSNIDATNRFAWTENAGWTNWRGEATPGQGAAVGSFVLSGFVWGENVGWINLGDGTPAVGVHYANLAGDDSGVNIHPDGSLHGYAWGENVGWINFDGGAIATPADPGDDARIDCDGRLNGFAWGENVGWVNLSSLEPGKFVAVEASFVPTQCDMNGDGAVNGKDVQIFVEIILLGGGDWRAVCAGDVGSPANRMIGVEDVAAFVSCLLDS